MRFITYFAHAGHKHLDSIVSDKGIDALGIAGIVVVIVAALVIGVMFYDARHESKIYDE